MISGDNSQEYIVPNVIESDNILYVNHGRLRDTYEFVGNSRLDELHRASRCRRAYGRPGLAVTSRATAKSMLSL